MLLCRYDFKRGIFFLLLSSLSQPSCTKYWLHPVVTATVFPTTTQGKGWRVCCDVAGKTLLMLGAATKISDCAALGYLCFIIVQITDDENGNDSRYIYSASFSDNSTQNGRTEDRSLCESSICWSVHPWPLTQAVGRWGSIYVQILVSPFGAIHLLHFKHKLRQTCCKLNCV